LDGSDQLPSPPETGASISITEEAADAGVFGVPTFVVRGQCFWGGDTIGWLNAFVDDPGMFGRGEMSRAAQIEFGAQRRV
jgi:hypothetical protein